MKFVISTKNNIFKLGNIRRKRIESLIPKLESKIIRDLASDNDLKVAVIVKGDREYNNETLASNNINYLMYSTVCFLEDYLSKDSYSKLSKTWKNQ